MLCRAETSDQNQIKDFFKQMKRLRDWRHPADKKRKLEENRPFL